MVAGLDALDFGLLSAAPTLSRLGDGRGRKVVVLGSGMAGLTSGYELSTAGCDVKVLGAREPRSDWFSTPRRASSSSNSAPQRLLGLG